MSYSFQLNYENEFLEFKVQPFAERSFLVTLTEEYLDLPLMYYFQALEDRWVMYPLGSTNRIILLKQIAQKIQNHEFQCNNQLFFVVPEFERYEDYIRSNPDKKL